MHGPTCIFWANLTPFGNYIVRVRKPPSRSRSWGNFSRLQLYSHRNAWANLSLSGRPDTVLARSMCSSSRSRSRAWPSSTRCAATSQVTRGWHCHFGLRQKMTALFFRQTIYGVDRCGMTAKYSQRPCEMTVSPTAMNRRPLQREGIHAPPCIFPSWLFIEVLQGCVRTTPRPPRRPGLCRGKFGSNVVEKCVTRAGTETLKAVMAELALDVKVNLTPPWIFY
jgi:hypothetical protein